MERGGYARLDADYLMQVRPHLTDREARVYEAVVLQCDGWDRPVATASIAAITRLHIDHVRKAMRSLETLNLIRCTWHGSPTSPSAQRSIVILRDYPAVVRALRAMGRIGPEFERAVGQISPESKQATGRNGPKTVGQISPETPGQIGPEHLISRSLPDPSIPPSQAGAPREPLRGATEGGRDGAEAEQIPSDLVELCRELWKTTEVPIKAARRYVAKLIAVGTPVASANEIAGYLRKVAKSHRVQTARCPIAVACMPEEFAAWLERHRLAHAAPTQRPSPGPTDQPLSREELGRRAATFSVQLARCLPDAHRLSQSVTRPPEAQLEIKSDVGT